MAPDVFYMDHEETVSVTVFNAPTATVELYLTNEPVDTSIFSRVNVRTQLGKNNTYQTRECEYSGNLHQSVQIGCVEYWVLGNV